MKTRLVLTLAAAAAAAFALSVPSLVGSAAAQDRPPAPPAAPGEGGAAPAAPQAKDAVHAAWDALMASREGINTARQSRDPEMIKAAQKASNDAYQAFLDAFRKCDVDAIDAAADKDMLGAGLNSMIAEAMNKDHDGKAAVKWCEMFVAKLGDTPGAAQVAGDQLADACVLAGDLPRAVGIWEKAAAGDDLGLKCNALINLGDVKSVKGDVEGARGYWKQMAGLPDGEGQRDPVKSMRPYVEQRLALLGNPAPEIDSKDWLGGEPAPLSSMKGKVVVVDMWATWCPPCRMAMPGLDALYREKKDQGLVVLGVTHYYQNGFMPNPGTKDPLRDGESVRGLTEAAFPGHLKQFKENVGISYPFVTTASDAEFKAYKVLGIPTMAVVGRDGVVGFVKVGGGDETLLKMAVDRMLAAGGGAAEAPAPTK